MSDFVAMCSEYTSHLKAVEGRDPNRYSSIKIPACR